MGWYIGNYRNDLKWAQWPKFGLLALTIKDTTVDATDELEASTLDYYSALRSAYRQIRANDIRNGAPAPLEDFDDMSSTTVAPFNTTPSILAKITDMFLSYN